MKKSLIMLSLGGLLLTSCTKSNITGRDGNQVVFAGEDNPHGGGGDNVLPASIPQVVMSAFNSAFPTATNIEWKRNGDGTFKVEFYIKGVKWQVTYSASGTVLKKEHK